MAVYLITFHTYRSWGPDHPRGYTRKGEGVLPPDPEMADRYDRDAKHPRKFLDDALQQASVAAVREIAKDHPWRLHYVYAGATHVHVLLSWRTFIDWNEVRVAIKRRLGKRLSEAAELPGPWFVRGGKDSRKGVTDRKHFDHLMTEYLPKPAHRGWHWREGCEAPWRVG